MQQMQTSLKFGILRNSIGEFAQPPASYAVFRSSIEGIPRTPRNQRTSNSQATSQRINAQTTSQHTNVHRSTTRFTQRVNIPTINADETSRIAKNSRARNVSLPWMTGGVKLCTNYCIVGLVCEHVGDNCPNGIHSTYDELSRTNQNIILYRLDTSHFLSWPGLRQGN